MGLIFSRSAGASLGILGGLGVLYWGFGLKSRENQAQTIGNPGKISRKCRQNIREYWA